jgi:hypothetical protein
MWQIKLIIYCCVKWKRPVMMAAWPKAWTVFARSNTGVMGLNPTRGMDVHVCLCCVCAILCVGSGFVTGWSPTKESCWLCIGLWNWKSGQGPAKGCRTINEWMNIKTIVNCEGYIPEKHHCWQNEGLKGTWKHVGVQQRERENHGSG